jgi:glycerophosphoryl diester phosphodiesterase
LIGRRARVVSSPALRAYFDLPRPALFGHRGVRGAAPENTLGAIRLAAAQGADGVEIDVRPCQSGELVVMHDATLARTAGDPRAVADVTRDQLRAMRVGGSEPVPLLGDVLDVCRELGLGLNVELKRDVPVRARAVWAAARELRARGTGLALVVSSFDPLMIAGFRALAPELPTALLVEPSSARRYRLGHVARHFGVAVHPERTMVSREWLERWHRQGLRVMVWTVNDPAEIRRLCELGVDGIVSDVPDAARAVM